MRTVEISGPGGRVDVPVGNGVSARTVADFVGRLGGLQVSVRGAPVRHVGAHSALAHVVGVGEASPAAFAYGAALGRPLHHVDDLQQFVAWAAHTDVPSVFAFVPERLVSARACERLLTTFHRLQTMLGVLAVPADPTAATIAAARLIGLRIRRHAYPRAIVMYSDFTRRRERRGCSSYGPNESDEFVSALAQGTSALVLHSHSNGADHRIGHHALCVQADALRPAPGRSGEAFLPCQAGGPCLRERLGLRSFVGASGVRAAIVVMVSCTGFVPYGGVIDPRFSFSTALLAGQDVQAIVTAYRLHVAQPALAEAALQCLAAALTTGQLAHALNDVTAGGAAYLCLGDPTLSLDAMAVSTTLYVPRDPLDAPRSDVTSRVAPEPPSPFRCLWLADDLLRARSDRRLRGIPADRLEEDLRVAAVRALGPKSFAASLASCDRLAANAASTLSDFDVGDRPESLSAAASAGAAARRLQALMVRRGVMDDTDTPDGSGLALARRLERAALGLERAATRRSSDRETIEGRAMLDRDLCAYVGRILAEGAYVYRYWSATGRMLPEQREADSHACCGHPLWSCDADTQPYPGSERRIWICGRCGLVGDTPRAVRLPRFAAGASGETGVLSGLPSSTPIWITTSVEAVGRQAEQPSGMIRASIQDPSTALRLPLPLARIMPGLRWYGVCVTWAGQFLVVRSPLGPAR